MNSKMKTIYSTIIISVILGLHFNVSYAAYQQDSNELQNDKKIVLDQKFADSKKINIDSINIVNNAISPPQL